MHKRAGVIRLFGQDRDALPPRQLRALEQRWGVLFQNGALFSSLTVRQNIQMPMRENRNISQRFMDDLAMLKLDLVGLPPDSADKLPAELSGGMVKRAALAKPSRSIRNWCFSMSRPRCSIQSAPPSSTN